MRGTCALLLAGSLAVAGGAEAQFTDITDRSGTGGEPGGPFPIGGGASFADLDGDGRLDLVVNALELRVYAQGADGRFVDRGPEVTADLGVEGVFGGHLPFDMDGDGDLDLLLLGVFGDALLRNEGDWVFRDVTRTHLPGEHYWSAAAAPGDFDGDGDVDLYVTTYIERLRAPMHVCERDRVLLNDGGGHFIDVTDEVGPGGGPLEVRGCGLAVLTLDADDDGDVDVMVGNDFGLQVVSSVLLRNDGPSAGGALRFADVSASTGFDAGLVYAMGVAIADVDGDARPDALMSSIGAPVLLLNGEDGYRDATRARGMDVRFASIGWQTTWGVALEDFDRDGAVDALMAGGQIAAASALRNGAYQPNVVLAGDGRGGFRPAPEWSLDEPRGAGRGLAVGDIDGDGDVDVAVAHTSGSAAMHRNDFDAPPPLRVELIATETSADAVGAHVEARCGGQVRHHWQIGGGSFAGARGGPVRVTFAAPCAEAGQPVTLRIRWPSGHTEQLASTTGAALRVVEEDWIARDGDRLTLAPRNAEGRLVAADAEVVVRVGDARAVAARVDAHFEVALPRTSGEARIEVDGALRSVALPLAPAPSLALHPRAPIAGEPVTISVRETSGVASGADVALVLGGVTLPAVRSHGRWAVEASMPEVPTEVVLHVDGEVGARTMLTPRAEVDLTRSDARFGGRLSLPIDPDLFRVSGRLRDANGRRVFPSLGRLSLLVDGSPAELMSARSDDTGIDLRVLRSTLRDGAVVELALDGVGLGTPRTYRALAAPEDALDHLDEGRSRCSPAVRYADADGRDVVGMIIALRDRFGEQLPMSAMGELPRLEGPLEVAGDATLLTYTVVQDYGRSTLEGPNEMQVSWFGRSLPVRCTIELGAARADVPMVGASSELEVEPDTLRVTEPSVGAEVIWRPRGANGRLLGSRTAGVWSTTIGSLVDTPRYVGLGEWTQSILPAGVVGEGTVEVVRGAERVQATLIVEGATRPDGGTLTDADVSVDAGPSAPDTGTLGGEGGVTGGGCSATGGGAAGWLLLLARRRRVPSARRPAAP